MTDLEIAKEVELKNIYDIAEKFGIKKDEINPYGKYKAKLDNSIFKRLEKNKDGKLILVTAINPTPLGEGKTTIAIGLSDALNLIGKNSVLALREPSLGPVFGLKGGATGGGKAQVAPMVDINLHFTGDIHAITTANNLLAALIDNHLFRGNKLKIKKVLWKRCLDLNDRALRKVEVGLSEEKETPREDNFDISVASEIMAILCLSEDIKDLERRLGNIIIGLDENDKPILAKELHAEGAMTAILKDAIDPNIVQTLEHNLAIIHGGPFANIAHGCNSVRATRLALKLGDYVVTEAGFGADLGAEKFFDVKCQKTGLRPDAVVIVATLKALKYHGGVKAAECKEENKEALLLGLDNLIRHVNNMEKVFNVHPVVAINRYYTDTDEEIELLKSKMEELGVEIEIADTWSDGGKGTKSLAEKVSSMIESGKKSDLKFSYDIEDPIEEKIRKVAQKVYGAEDIVVSDDAKEQIKILTKLGFDKVPICIAKTQYSFSDDPKNLVLDKPFNINITSVEARGGAEFLVVKTGKVMTMPGLPKVPAAENIGVDENGEIVGIF